VAALPKHARNHTAAAEATPFYTTRKMSLAYPRGAEGGVGHEAGRRRGQRVRVRRHGHGVRRVERPGPAPARRPLASLQSLDLPPQHQRVKVLQVLWGDQAAHLGQQGELRGGGDKPQGLNQAFSILLHLISSFSSSLCFECRFNPLQKPEKSIEIGRKSAFVRGERSPPLRFLHFSELFQPLK